MLRRSFLKIIGAIAAAAYLPISLVKAATTRGPAAVCPCCGSENVSCKNGEFKCYNVEHCGAEGQRSENVSCKNGEFKCYNVEHCGAEGQLVARFSVTKWTGTE